MTLPSLGLWARRALEEARCEGHDLSFHVTKGSRGLVRGDTVPEWRLVVRYSVADPASGETTIRKKRLHSSYDVDLLNAMRERLHEQERDRLGQELDSGQET